MSDEVQLIKERIDLADLINEYVPLKRYGGHWKGLCPFHQEKTPSFVVSPDKGIWHCFGCGESGDHFTFVQRLEGLDFVSTLKLLAERAGVTLQARTNDAPSRDNRPRLFELLDIAAKFYHEILINHTAGSKARAYLAERGVHDATMKEFLIGYSPNGWDTTQQFLRRKGFSDAEMEASGLVGRSDTGKHFDRFRGRIMFPIHDIQGRVVAFGGRITPWHATGQEGKYVNSPETAIYHKRRTVYNLHRAKPAIRQQQTAIVVEGYMDVVMLSQSGVPHVVASSGTAFTTEQIEQLRRFTTTLHFAFDADAAGIHAAIAATASALQSGLRVATILFPAGQDPADVAHADPARAKVLVQQPQPLTRVLLARFKEESHTPQREELLTQILPLLKSVHNVVQQGEMVQEIAELLHVPESTILEQLARLPASSTPTPAPTPDAAPARLSSEQYLLGLLLLEPTVRHELLAQLPPALFTQEDLRALATRLRDLVQQNSALSQSDVDTLLTHLGDAFVPLAEALRQATAHERHRSTLEALPEAATLGRLLRRRALENRLKSLQAELSRQAGTPHPDTLQQFQATVSELSQVGT